MSSVNSSMRAANCAAISGAGAPVATDAAPSDHVATVPLGFQRPPPIQTHRAPLALSGVTADVLALMTSRLSPADHAALTVTSKDIHRSTS